MFDRMEVSPHPKNPGKKNYIKTGPPLMHPGEENSGNGKKICKGCGFRIRGTVENHEAGAHHQGRRNGK